MEKNTFRAEFEIHASKKMLFPYIYTASGLSQWMADDVTVDEDKVFNFKWEGEDHKAKMIGHRINSYVKFEFLPENEEETEEPSYIELRLEMNEITQMVFIAVTDYNDIDDNEELMDLWEGLIHNLKEIVGG
ncbi:MAG: START-like domain-containing protein [Bacteroidota bacterium]